MVPVKFSGTQLSPLEVRCLAAALEQCWHLHAGEWDELGRELAGQLRPLVPAERLVPAAALVAQAAQVLHPGSLRLARSEIADAGLAAMSLLALLENDLGGYSRCREELQVRLVEAGRKAGPC